MWKPICAPLWKIIDWTIMTLYVHKTRTYILNMTAIGNIFISNNDERNRKFGMFRDGDIKKNLIAKMQARKQFEIRMLIFTVLICVLLIIFLHWQPLFQLHFACDSRTHLPFMNSRKIILIRNAWKRGADWGSEVILPYSQIICTP